jgi:hypothetical protein
MFDAFDHNPLLISTVDGAALACNATSSKLFLKLIQLVLTQLLQVKHMYIDPCMFPLPAFTCRD